MNAPTRDEFELLQEICLQISSVDKEVKKFGPLDDLPKSKRQKLLEIEDRNDKKIKEARPRLNHLGSKQAPQGFSPPMTLSQLPEN